MQREFKHPQIFADVLILMQMYYPLHQNFPKPFRFAVGECILTELAQALRLIVLANAADKKTSAGCTAGAGEVAQVRAGVEVIRGFLLLAWKMKFLSHGALVELSVRLEAVSRQAARWQQWFEERALTVEPVIVDNA